MLIFSKRMQSGADVPFLSSGAFPEKFPQKANDLASI